MRIQLRSVRLYPQTPNLGVQCSKVQNPCGLLGCPSLSGLPISGNNQNIRLAQWLGFRRANVDCYIFVIFFDPRHQRIISLKLILFIVTIYVACQTGSAKTKSGVQEHPLLQRRTATEVMVTRDTLRQSECNYAFSHDIYMILVVVIVSLLCAFCNCVNCVSMSLFNHLTADTAEKK